MLGSRRTKTVIGDGLKICGNVTAEGLVEINGQIEGDLHQRDDHWCNVQGAAVPRRVTSVGCGAA